MRWLWIDRAAERRSLEWASTRGQQLAEPRHFTLLSVMQSAKRLGVSIEHGVTRADRAGVTHPFTLVKVPHWLPAGLLLLMPGVWTGTVIARGVRGRVWRRRGRCPACGYDLRGSAGERCPECGLENAPRERGG
jgi:hypothetical protein